jgi:hypothetical protein
MLQSQFSDADMIAFAAISGSQQTYRRQHSSARLIEDQTQLTTVFHQLHTLRCKQLLYVRNLPAKARAFAQSAARIHGVIGDS